jgi:hypothetical protein
MSAAELAEYRHDYAAAGASPANPFGGQRGALRVRVTPERLPALRAAFPEYAWEPATGPPR